MRDVGKISQAATDWFIRLLERPVPESVREQFADWLLQSPDHVQAYLAISRTWSDIGLIQHFPVIEGVLGPQADQEGDVIESSFVPTRRRLRRAWIVPAAIASCAALAFCLCFSAWFTLRAASHIETAVGEIRSVVLTDGSVAQLNTATVVSLDLSSHERNVRLIQGEAQFSVAKDPARPFIVTTPHGSVHAHGTVFNVQVGPSQTAVAVIEGRVELIASPNASERLLTRHMDIGVGQKAIVTHAGDISPNGGPSLERVSTWPQRRLVFQDEPLTAVIAEFNRYLQQPLKIADSGIGSLHITGSFAVNDVASLLDFLEKYEGIVTRHSGDGERVLVRAEARAIPSATP